MSKAPQTITILVLVALILSAFGLFYVNRATAGDTYVRGRYGVRCYIKGQENRAIKPENLLSYPTLELCVTSFSD